MQEFDKLFFRLSNLSGVRGTSASRNRKMALATARFAGTHSCATSGTL